jgi:hypothetical protein
MLGLQAKLKEKTGNIWAATSMAKSSSLIGLAKLFS